MTDDELRARVEEMVAQMNANPALMAKLRSSAEVMEAAHAVIQTCTEALAILDDPNFDWDDGPECQTCDGKGIVAATAGYGADGYEQCPDCKARGGAAANG